MVSRNRKIARRIGQAVANDVLDISGAISAGAGVTVYATADDLPTTGLTAGDEAFVSGSNRLYISNGTGWYSIGLVNTNPAITSVEDPSSNTTPFTLATDGSALVLTITAADPEDIPLTYSYAVTTGSLTNGGGTTATVVQGTGANTNQFTITPTTTEAYAGTFDLTFTTSDGINQASSVNNFTLNFITIIANSRYTTLLATATGTSDNNNITDASANSHTITVNGDAHTGTFSPYRSVGYSAYFGTGGSERITVEGTKSTLAGANADFSISAWIYPTAGNDKWIYGTNVSNNNQAGWHDLYLEGSTKLVWRHSDGSTHRSMMSTNPVSLNEWSYILINRTSNVTYMYINGSLVAQNSDMTYALYTRTNAPSIGIRYFYDTSAINLDFEGYITDVHVKTAAISSPTTVPTERPVSDSDTWLLTAHLPYFADGSSNNYTVGAYNGSSIKPFSPYDYNEYSATDHGGSVYFDGNTDTIHTASTHNFANNGFNVSFWYYPTLAQGVLFASASNHIGTMHFSGSLSSSEIRYEYKNSSGSNTNLIGNNAAKPIYFSWNYLQIVQDSNGHIRIYSNGTQVGSTVTNAAMSGASSTAVTLGDWGSSGSSSGFQGYISDFNLTTETSPSTAVPIAPRSSTSNTKLLISGTDASIIDKSQVNNIVMNGPTTGSTTKSAFGSEPTISFVSGSNTNRYLNFDPNVLNFMEILGQPSIPFTIEGIWGWQGSTASPIFEIFQDTNNFFYFGGGTGNTQSGITTDYNLHAIFKIGGVERFKMTAGIGSYYHVGSSFKHQAITRHSSGLMQHYYDGQLRPTTIIHAGTDTVSWTSPVGYIGRSDWMGIYGRYEGYIHQIRLTVGLARYTANFTPPTASLEG